MSFQKLLVTIVMVLSFPVIISAQDRQSRKALICLTYDDALPSHVETVLPQLDSMGLKATFFLNSIQGASDKIGEPSRMLRAWRNAARKGHELGNHTLFHPCPSRFGWPADVAIESYTIDRLLKEVRVMGDFMNLIDSNNTARSFAFPCNNNILQGKNYGEELRKAGLIGSARGGGDRNSVITDLGKVDSMFVPSWLVEEGTSLNELIAYAEKAKKHGGLAIYQFHGIGAEFFKVDADTHRRFLVYLNNNHATYEVVTFSQALAEIKKRK